MINYDVFFIYCIFFLQKRNGGDFYSLALYSDLRKSFFFWTAKIVQAETTGPPLRRGPGTERNGIRDATTRWKIPKLGSRHLRLATWLLYNSRVLGSRREDKTSTPVLQYPIAGQKTWIPKRFHTTRKEQPQKKPLKAWEREFLRKLGTS